MCEVGQPSPSLPHSLTSWLTRLRLDERITGDFAMRKMKAALRPFDVSHYLEDDEVVRAYREAVAESASPGAQALAERNIAKARERKDQR